MAIGQDDATPLRLHLDTELERLALAWVERNRACRSAVERWASEVSDTPFGAVDPTRGAVRFHRHDENPHWARGLAPVALIGAFLFYAD